MSELDPLDQRLDRAWQSLSPPDGLAARVRARLASTGAAPAATPKARLASRWRALRASGPLGAGAGALLLGVGIALGYLIPRELIPREPLEAHVPAPSAPGQAESPPLPPPAAPVTSAPASMPPVPTERAASETAASTSAAPASLTGTSTHAPRARREPAAPARTRAHTDEPAAVAKPDPGAELLLLERAERAVRSRNPALALALIEELERAFPRSPLHEERRSIELMAHCQALHARAGANAADTSSDVTADGTADRLARFRRQYPESVYSARIADECDEAPPAASLTKRAAPDIDGAEGGNDVQHDSPEVSDSP